MQQRAVVQHWRSGILPGNPTSASRCPCSYCRKPPACIKLWKHGKQGLTWQGTGAPGSSSAMDNRRQFAAVTSAGTGLRFLRGLGLPPTADSNVDCTLWKQKLPDMAVRPQTLLRILLHERVAAPLHHQQRLRPAARLACAKWMGSPLSWATRKGAPLMHPSNATARPAGPLQLLHLRGPGSLSSSHQKKGIKVDDEPCAILGGGMRD